MGNGNQIDYTKYINALSAPFPWIRLETIYFELGNAPGIYPDVALLLEQTVKLPNVHHVVEFGSGASTAYLFATAIRKGAIVRTFEEEIHWQRMTQALLDLLDVNGKVELYTEFNPLLRPDAIFLDCQPTLRRTIHKYHPAVFANCGMILVDDAEKDWIQRPFMEFLEELHRMNSYFYNPTNREDRTVLINVLDKSFDIEAWVQSWLP